MSAHFSKNCYGLADPLCKIRKKKKRKGEGVDIGRDGRNIRKEKVRMILPEICVCILQGCEITNFKMR